MTDDWQDAQHQDMLIMQRGIIENLAEMHRLVDACSDFTTLNETDVRNIAAACGVYEEYLQAIAPKPKEEPHAYR